jgi:hypothetical protein
VLLSPVRLCFFPHGLSSPRGAQHASCLTPHAAATRLAAHLHTRVQRQGVQVLARELLVRRGSPPRGDARLVHLLHAGARHDPGQVVQPGHGERQRRHRVVAQAQLMHTSENGEGSEGSEVWTALTLTLTLIPAR